MKVYALEPLQAAKHSSTLGGRIANYAKRAAGQLAALNARIDRGHQQRDLANQNNSTVDGAYWVFLR